MKYNRLFSFVLLILMPSAGWGANNWSRDPDIVAAYRHQSGADMGKDSSGNGNDLTNDGVDDNSVYAVEGGWCGHYVGVNTDKQTLAYASLPADMPGKANDQTFSVTGYFRRDSAQWVCIAAMWDSALNERTWNISVWDDTGYKLKVLIGHTGGTASYTITNTVSQHEDDVYYFAVIFDAGTVHTYLYNVTDSTDHGWQTDTTTWVNPMSYDQGCDLGLGDYTNNDVWATLPMYGQMDEVIIWKRALEKYEAEAVRLQEYGDIEETCPDPVSISPVLGPVSPLTEGLVAYWPCLEGTGTGPYSLQGHVLSLVNHAAWKQSEYAWSIWFDGTDDRADTGVTFSEITPASDYSLSFWVRFDNVVSRNTGLFSQVAGSSDRFEIHVSNSGAPEINFGHYNGVSYNASKADTTVAVETWYHIVAVNTGETQAKKLYMNGVDDTASGLGSSPGSTPQVFRWGAVATTYLSGELRDVAIFSRALTAADAVNLYTDSHQMLMGLEGTDYASAEAGPPSAVPRTQSIIISNLVPYALTPFVLLILVLSFARLKRC